MTVQYLGSLSLSQALPGAALAASMGITGIQTALPDLLARIAALRDFSPTPISFATQLQLAEATLSGIQASIAAGLPAPSVDAQVTAVLALMESLLTMVNGVRAALAVVQDFQNLLAAAGISVFAFSGDFASMGVELSAAVGMNGPAGSGYAVVLATGVAGTWSAMGQIFKVVP